MTAVLLGRMNTDVGPVELDYSGGVFTTSRAYFDPRNGQRHETIIVEGRENAEWWYGQMAERGHVFGAMPEAVTP